jgi:hypothetical protein
MPHLSRWLRAAPLLFIGSLSAWAAAPYPDFHVLKDRWDRAALPKPEDFETFRGGYCAADWGRVSRMYYTAIGGLRDLGDGKLWFSTVDSSEERHFEHLTTEIREEIAEEVRQRADAGDIRPAYVENGSYVSAYLEEPDPYHARWHVRKWKDDLIALRTPKSDGVEWICFYSTAPIPDPPAPQLLDPQGILEASTRFIGLEDRKFEELMAPGMRCDFRYTQGEEEGTFTDSDPALETLAGFREWTWKRDFGTGSPFFAELYESEFKRSRGNFFAREIQALMDGNAENRRPNFFVKLESLARITHPLASGQELDALRIQFRAGFVHRPETQLLRTAIIARDVPYFGQLVYTDEHFFNPDDYTFTLSVESCE